MAARKFGIWAGKVGCEEKIKGMGLRGVRAGVQSG